MAEAASPSSHLKAQTGPNDESATTHDLLECLQAHLSPQPAFSVLPAALHILAHFEVLATRVEAEVERALKYNDKLAMILDQGGHKASSSTGHGALVTARRDALEKLQKNVVEQNLRVKVFESSLEWRCIVSVWVEKLPVTDRSPAHDCGTFRRQAECNHQASQHVFSRNLRSVPALSADQYDVLHTDHATRAM